MKVSDEAKRTAGAIAKIAKVTPKNNPAAFDLAVEVERHAGIARLKDEIANLRIELDSIKRENAALLRFLGKKAA